MNRSIPPRALVRRPLTAALAAALLLAACGGEQAQPETAAEPEDSATGAPEAGAASEQQPIELFAGMEAAEPAEEVDTSAFATDDSSLVIGYASLNLANSFQVQRLEAAKLVAEEYGVEFIVTNANNDPSKQVADVEDLLAQGVNGIIITPATEESLGTVLGRATSANIPVIADGSQVTSPDITTQIFATNDYIGEVGGEGLCEILGGEGDVVMLRGIAGIQSETDRYDGARAALDGCGLNVVGEAFGNWEYAGGRAASETLVAQHPEIDGVWSSGAQMSRAFLDVLREEGRDFPPITGESENGFLQLWEEEELESIAPNFPTWQTPEAVKLMLLILRGEPVQASYELRLPPITNDTLDQFVNADLSDDWFSDGYVTEEQHVETYLTPEQVEQIFPSE